MLPATYHIQHVWQENKPPHNVQVSPQSATRTAAKFLAKHVTMMAMADTPTLIVEEPTVWQFPVVLTIPKLGRVSTIGQVQVDAFTGEIIEPTSTYLENMKTLAYAIAKHFSLSTADDIG